MFFDVFLLSALHVNRIRKNKPRNSNNKKKIIMKEKKKVLFKSCMNVVDTRDALSLNSITERLSSFSS